MKIEIEYLLKDGTPGSIMDKDSSPFFLMRAPEAFFKTLREALDICANIYDCPVFLDHLYMFKVKVSDGRSYMFRRGEEHEMLLNKHSLMLHASTRAENQEEGLLEDLKTLKDFYSRLSGIEKKGAVVMKESIAIMIAGTEFLLGTADFRDASIRLKESVKEIQRYKNW